MSVSKYQQLAKIVNEDYTNTYSYVKKNLEFIHQFCEKLASYLDCGIDNFFCFNSEGDKIPVQNFIQGSITVDNEVFFIFELLISLKNEPFNINNSGRSFYEKGLTPPSGVVLLLDVKQQEDSFVVKAPAITEEQVIEKEITIKPDIDDSWIDLLDSCFHAIKKTVEGGLEERISKLGIQTDNASQRAFGFRG